MYERVVAFLTSVQEFFVLNRQTPKTRKTKTRNAKTRKAKTRKTKTLVFFFRGNHQISAFLSFLSGRINEKNAFTLTNNNLAAFLCFSNETIQVTAGWRFRCPLKFAKKKRNEANQCFVYFTKR